MEADAVPCSRKLPFAEVEKYFRPIILKKLERGAQYGDRQVVKVSFCTQSDIQGALQNYQNKYLMGHRVTLTLPDEAEKEMADTEAGWKSLPDNLVDDILKLVAPFRTGKSLKRVCQMLAKLTSCLQIRYTATSPTCPLPAQVSPDLLKVGVAQPKLCRRV